MDGERDAEFRAVYDWERIEPSVTIITAIASLGGVDPNTLVAGDRNGVRSLAPTIDDYAIQLTDSELTVTTNE